ncbi:unnamed protein product [Hymenolepis diminuta]|uniref:TAZ-type domain-containing protein n=1 Tax=Hymenolepis diminuta TaxID=6216 RepID=A0A564Z2N0_HYMDI|nr:unnamed protein product [Hymenolepis diminuta]
MVSLDFMDSLHKLDTYCSNVCRYVIWERILIMAFHKCWSQEAQLIKHTESCENYGSCIIPRCAFTKSLGCHVEKCRDNRCHFCSVSYNFKLKDYPSKGQSWRQFVPFDRVRVIVQDLTNFIFPSKSGMATKDFIAEYQKELEIFSEIIYAEAVDEIDFFNKLFDNCGGLL